MNRDGGGGLMTEGFVKRNVTRKLMKTDRTLNSKKFIAFLLIGNSKKVKYSMVKFLCNEYTAVLQDWPSPRL